MVGKQQPPIHPSQSCYAIKILALWDIKMFDWIFCEKWREVDCCKINWKH